MKLKLKKATAEKIGLKNLEAFGLSSRSWAFRDDEPGFIDLTGLALPAVEQLRALLVQHEKDRAVKNLVLNVVAYQLAASGEGHPTAKSCEQMATFMTQLLRTVDRHWVWRQAG